MCTESRQAGFSLIEVIVAMLLVSVGVVGLLAAMNTTVRGSADPMLRKQGIAAAESLLEEIMLKDYANPPGGYSGSDRSQFDDVGDYDGYATTGIVGIDGTPIGGLGAYAVSVAVADVTLNGIGAKRITTTITLPDGETVSLSAYRANL